MHPAISHDDGYDHELISHGGKWAREPLRETGATQRQVAPSSDKDKSSPGAREAGKGSLSRCHQIWFLWSQLEDHAVTKGRGAIRRTAIFGCAVEIAADQNQAGNWIVAIRAVEIQ